MQCTALLTSWQTPHACWPRLGRCLTDRTSGTTRSWRAPHSAPARHADLAYADNYASSGSYTQLNPTPEYALTGATQGQTYQPHWCAEPWS